MEIQIEDIIRNQKITQAEVDKHKHSFTDIRDLVMSYMIAINGEVDECNREVGFQWWKNRKEVDKEALYRELADIFIFWLDLCMRLGIEDRIFSIIASKQTENIARQRGLVEGREDYKA